MYFWYCCAVCCLYYGTAVAAAAAVRHRLPDGIKLLLWFNCCIWFQCFRSLRHLNTIYFKCTDPLAVLISHLQPRCTYNTCHTSSATTGTRGAKADVSPPRRSPPCIHIPGVYIFSLRSSVVIRINEYQFSGYMFSYFFPFLCLSFVSRRLNFSQCIWVSGVLLLCLSYPVRHGIALSTSSLYSITIVRITSVS